VLAKLGLRPDEWDSCPWYHQQALLEELADQMDREREERRELFRAIGAAAMGFEMPDEAPRADPDAPAITSGALRGMGFNVETG
jgi:hypothetical protein